MTFLGSMLIFQGVCTYMVYPSTFEGKVGYLDLLVWWLDKNKTVFPNGGFNGGESHGRILSAFCQQI